MTSTLAPIPQAEKATAPRTNALLDDLIAGRRKFELEPLLELRRAVLAEKIDAAVFRASFDSYVDSVEDDLVSNVYARAEMKLETAIAEFAWAKKVAEASIFRRLVARATPKPADDQPTLHDNEAEEAVSVELKSVELPHPSLDIVLEPIYGPYAPDPDVIETILPKLKPEEREKALTIIPEERVKRQVIPAHVKPRELKIGATGSLKSLRDRYKDSAVGKILARELRREFKGWKLIIKPIVTKPDAKNVTPSQAALS